VVVRYAVTGRSRLKSGFNVPEQRSTMPHTCINTQSFYTDTGPTSPVLSLQCVDPHASFWTFKSYRSFQMALLWISPIVNAYQGNIRCQFFSLWHGTTGIESSILRTQSERSTH